MEFNLFRFLRRPKGWIYRCQVKHWYWSTLENIFGYYKFIEAFKCRKKIAEYPGLFVQGIGLDFVFEIVRWSYY